MPWRHQLGDGTVSRTQYTIQPMTIMWYYIERIHGSRNQSVEVGVAFITIIPKDPVGGIYTSPILQLLGSVGLEVLAPRDDMLLPEDIVRFPLDFKQQLPPADFGFFVPQNKQAEKESAFCLRN